MSTGRSLFDHPLFRKLRTAAGNSVSATITDGLVDHIKRAENAEDGWTAGNLQDQQDELDAAWRKNKPKGRGRPPGLCGLNGVAYSNLRGMVSGRSPHNAQMRRAIWRSHGPKSLGSSGRSTDTRGNLARSITS